MITNGLTDTPAPQLCHYQKPDEIFVSKYNSYYSLCIRYRISCFILLGFNTGLNIFLSVGNSYSMESNIPAQFLLTCKQNWL